MSSKKHKNGFTETGSSDKVSGFLPRGQGGAPEQQLADVFIFFTLCMMVVEDELSGIQRELSMYPERAFDFQHAGTIVIEKVNYIKYAAQPLF